MDDRMNKLHEMVDKGIDEIIAKGSFDKDTVCIADKLVDIRKDLAAIMAMEEDGYDEYSRMYPHSYMDDASYARRRDSRGRYSRDNGMHSRGHNDYNSYRHSYERGYSRADGKEEMISNLEEALRMATNEQERESIRRLIMQAQNG